MSDSVHTDTLNVIHAELAASLFGRETELDALKLVSKNAL